jgi:hypothetical protein
MVNALTQRHRAQQLLLRRATQAQIDKIWATLVFEDLDGSYPRFALLASQVVERNRLTSSGLASSYVRNFRKALRVGGELEILTAEPLVVDQFNAALHTTSVAALKSATENRVPEATAVANALTETRGAMARLVLNAGRETVTRTTVNDSRAAGWQRVLGGGGCDFCRMLSSRGDVYSEETAGFEAHDHCGCSAEPVYR